MIIVIHYVLLKSCEVQQKNKFNSNSYKFEGHPYITLITQKYFFHTELMLSSINNIGNKSRYIFILIHLTAAVRLSTASVIGHKFILIS